MAKQTPRTLPSVVLDTLKEGLQGKVKEPNLGEVAQHFFDLAGGERQVAKLLLDQYSDPDCPNSVKTKIMQFMLMHLKWINDRAGKADELGSLNEDDILRELDTHIKAVAKDAHDKAKNKEKLASAGRIESS